MTELSRCIKASCAVLAMVGALPVLAQSDLTISPAYRLNYSRQSDAVYQVQSSSDLINWRDMSYAIRGPAGDDDCWVPGSPTGNVFFRMIAGSPTNVMDYSSARMLPMKENMMHFENVRFQGKRYWVDVRAVWGLRETDRGELPTVTIPRATITLDGDPSDWAAIPPIYTDPAHDQQPPVDSAGSDAQELRLAHDDQYIYAAFFLHDGNPSTADTLYWVEFTQFWKQLHVPGDSYFYAHFDAGASQWVVEIGQREAKIPTRGDPNCVKPGQKFIEFRVLLSDIEYDGGGLLPKIGIEGRFIRSYVHHIEAGNPGNPLSSYDAVGEDNKRMIVDFYKNN